MAEYIDREKAIETVKFYDGYNDPIPWAVDSLKVIPAADVAPVVRCRDCDLWNEWDHAGHENLGNFRCSCAYWTVEDGVTFYTAPTDFCSYGEKRKKNGW